MSTRTVSNNGPFGKLQDSLKKPKRTANMYTIPLEDVFCLLTTDQQLNSANTSSKTLQTRLLNVAHDMEKLFPVKLTNKVYRKFLPINIDFSTVLLHHTTNEISNQELERNKLLVMNNTIIQALANALANF